MSRHENAAKRLAAGALVSDLLGFCFMVVGIFGPAWLVVNNEKGQLWIHEGIWFSSYCNNSECKTSTRENVKEELGGQFFSDLEESHWKEFKVLSILAIAGSCVAVVTTTVVLVKKSKKFRTHTLILSGFSALCSSMFLLIPVLKTSYVDSAASFSGAWTKIVAYIGVFFHFLATVIQMFAIYQSFQNYCEEKKQIRRQQRRLDMVGRYLSLQQSSHGTVILDSGFHLVLESQRELSIPVTELRANGNNSDLTDPPPYSVTSELPAYPEEVSGLV